MRIEERFVGFALEPRSATRRYAVAIGLALTSLFSIFVLQRVEATPFTSVGVLSVILSAIYGGRGPAWVDSLITAIGTDYLFVAPNYQVFDSLSSIVRVGVYFLIGFLVAGLMDVVRKAYVSLRVQLEETDRARRAREEVLAIVSHDLRTPLSAVVMNAYLIERLLAAGDDQAQAARQAAIIRRSGQRMSRMVEDLLDASRMEAGTFHIEPAPNDLGPIVSESIAGLMPAAERKSVRIVPDLPDEALPALCDRDRVVQVLENLIGNAIKFSPEGADVDVVARREGEQIVLSVCDRGPGIAEDELPQVFGRHWQASATAHLGAGLGLFISRGIVEAHGGRLEVDSRAGEGARFTARLPALPAAEGRRVAPAEFLAV